MAISLNKNIQILLAIILSGACFYFSLGLSGNFGFLFWPAPILILQLSFVSSARKTLLIAFAAYFIGRLSLFNYMIPVVGLARAITLTFLLSLIFGVIVMLARKLVIRTGHWYSVFAFPVIFTTFEFLVFKFSADGSAGSIAYSQSNILPLIQIASVTGILGITFIITFIPSAIATAWYFRKQKTKLKFIAACAIIITAGVFLLGITRLNTGAEKNVMKVGLAVLDEKLHHITQQPDIEKEKQSAENYANLVSTLADDGDKLAVLPERAINMTPETEPVILNIFSSLAKQKHIFIITGYTNFKTDIHRNSLLVIDTAGKVMVDYNKVFLVPGLEKQFTPGKDIGLFTIDNTPAGAAICKDLDFPSYIKRYGAANIMFMTIPAWDFVKDGWLHSRMAVLRGVENGFSEVRTAREGRLTISDGFGRVTAEKSSEDGKEVSLSGNVSLQKINTIYSRWGDWFGVINCLAMAVFVLTSWRYRKRTHHD